MNRALFRVDFDVCQRSRGGDAVKLAAYNACTRLAHNGRVYDFRRKAKEHVGRTLLLTPHGFSAEAFPNPGALWRAAEAAENRGNSQTARQVLVTIPREVPADKRVDFVKHLCRPLQESGMVLQVDLHDPGARDGNEQPHAHILATMREMDGNAFAKTKVKGRDWNKLFTENRGREMRARFAERMNHWFDSEQLDIRVDHRTNAEVYGPEFLPPGPQISREAVEIEKRIPGTSHQIPRLDLHRRRVRAVQDIEAEIAQAEVQTAIILRRVSRRQQQEPRRQPMAQQRTNKPAWMQMKDGRAGLSAAHLASAQRSYKKWRERQLADGKKPAEIFVFDAYVDYVQERRAAAKPDIQNPQQDAVRQRHPDEPAPLPGETEDDAHGWTRRKRFLANLLAEHYDLSELDPALVAHIKRIKLDRDARTAIVFLTDGSHFTDHGDRVEFHGQISRPSAAEIAAAAARHGWSSVAITGSPEFREETAIALALREPPIAHDHTLSPAAAARLARLLADQSPARQTNTINQTTETTHDHPAVDSISPRPAADDGAAGSTCPDDSAAGSGGVAVLDTPASVPAGDAAGDHDPSTHPAWRAAYARAEAAVARMNAVEDDDEDEPQHVSDEDDEGDLDAAYWDALERQGIEYEQAEARLAAQSVEPADDIYERHYERTEVSSPAQAAARRETPRERAWRESWQAQFISIAERDAIYERALSESIPPPGPDEHEDDYQFAYEGGSEVADYLAADRETAIALKRWLAQDDERIVKLLGQRPKAFDTKKAHADASRSVTTRSETLAEGVQQAEARLRAAQQAKSMFSSQSRAEATAAAEALTAAKEERDRWDRSISQRYDGAAHLAAEACRGRQQEIAAFDARRDVVAARHRQEVNEALRYAIAGDAPDAAVLQAADKHGPEAARELVDQRMQQQKQVEQDELKARQQAQLEAQRRQQRDEYEGPRL